MAAASTVSPYPDAPVPRFEKREGDVGRQPLGATENEERRAREAMKTAPGRAEPEPPRVVLEDRKRRSGGDRAVVGKAGDRLAGNPAEARGSRGPDVPVPVRGESVDLLA